MFKKTLDFLIGKKTYIFSVIAIIYGAYFGDFEAVSIGLIGLGLRHALATEISETIKALSKKKKSPVK